MEAGLLISAAASIPGMCSRNVIGRASKSGDCCQALPASWRNSMGRAVNRMKLAVGVLSDIDFVAWVYLLVVKNLGRGIPAFFIVNLGAMTLVVIVG